MRRLAGLLAALLVVVVPNARASDTTTGWAACMPYDPATVAATGTSTEADIPMSDGAALRATVTLPDGVPGPYPTALTITGYGRGTGGSAGSLVRHGYATVLVDDRGTGTSDGEWDSWGPRTRADYAEVLDWIVGQPWSDGRIGVTGGSYLGITALFAAATEHAAVRAVFAEVPMADAYRDITFAGGEINTAFIPVWLAGVTALGLQPGTDPAVLAQHLGGAMDFQVPTVVDSMTGGDTAYDGPFWRQRSPIEAVPQIHAPTFIVGGLDDIFQRGEPLLYEALAAQGTDARLLLGPWTHTTVGDGLPADGVPDIGDLLVQWFDQHVRGITAGADCIPPVTQFVRGDDRYETSPGWPVPGLHAERWHLHGDGRLDTAAPVGAEPERLYVQVPVTGVCTRSTNQWLIGIIDDTPCATDNQLDETTSLTWTSEPFTEPSTINGPIEADVWLRTTAPEAVVSVAVSDVAPDGTSRGLTNGLLRASQRAVDPARSRLLDGQSIQPWHPFTREATQPVTPLEPMLLPVEVFPTSATILPGHRLRITVAPYDVPHALPPLVPGTLSVGGITTVLSDPQHPTSVVLPVG